MAQRIEIASPVGGRATLNAVAIRLHPEDDVAIARVPLAPGLVIDDLDLTVRQPISAGHKFALRAVCEGEPVRRYGQIIGTARSPIKAGEHVHTHNLGVEGAPSGPHREYAAGTDVRPVAPAAEQRTFQGFRRGSGRAGTRNYVAVISSVNCSASVSRAVADHFRADLAHDFPHVDGVIALTHKGGCGAHYGGPEVDLLQRTLAGFARHPNIAGYVLIGLGCEINQIPDLVEHQALGTPRSLVIQEEGGLVATVEAGVRAVRAILPAAERCRREAVSVAELAVALQCGGSDAWSGITANPALGHAADLLVAQGGTVVLAETPEVYGAEHLLIRRAASAEVAEQLLARIRWWEEYTAMHGAEIDNNPTPGNKLGGLTTIYEKSLGAVAKSGTSPLAGVLEYAEPVQQAGFLHMDTPGYDPVSVTGQVAGGCTLVCFTTGRGSVFGCRPAPTIKIASTSDLYRRMAGDMDIDAGRALGDEGIEGVGREIFERMLAVASGEKTSSERHGIGEEEFNPWILGATL